MPEKKKVESKEGTPTHSPTSIPKPVKKPVRPIYLNFPTAIQAMIDGKIITKMEWNNPFIICFLGKYLKIRLDGIDRDWTVSDGDMAGHDWIVLDPYPPDPEEWDKLVIEYAKRPHPITTVALRVVGEEFDIPGEDILIPTPYPPGK